MRRVSSTQQNKGIAIGVEQFMNRQQVRGNSGFRATSSAHRVRSWLFVLAASFLGFGCVIALWTWLPPSTLLGVTAQAQAQQAQENSAHAHSATHTQTRGNSGSLDVGFSFDLSQPGSNSRSSASPAKSTTGSQSIATGSYLVKQAQQQLQQQKQQQHQRQHHNQRTTGRGSFRGGSSDNVISSANIMTSSAATQQQQQQQQQHQHQLHAVPPSAQIVVVGGGLAGLVAALQAAECLEEAAAASAASAASGGGAVSATPANTSSSCLPVLCGASAAAALSAAVSTPSYSVDVLLVEKMPKLGGNSAKASSGINALHPEGGDRPDVFVRDVEVSGGGASRPELVEELVLSSPAALGFLSAHGVTSLGGVTRLGGHSVARTRTVSGGANVGWVIMSSLIEAVGKHPRIRPLAKIYKFHMNARVLEGHALHRIITTTETTANGGLTATTISADSVAVTAVELVAAGGPDGRVISSGGGSTSGDNSTLSSPPIRPTSTSTSTHVVVVACGALVLATGGFAANKELIRSVAPEAADLATTNGPWARGESLSLAAAAGAALVGLEDVQVHPTGFVDPREPEAGTKFLAPEKLRGVGALLLDSQANRFVDELARRDVVAAAMMQLPGRKAWLLLGRDAGAEYGTSALEFYCKRGLMRKAESLSEAAAAMSVAEDVLRGQLEAYVKAATAGSDAAGAGGRDPYGKRVFPHPPDPDLQLPLYLAQVTPVVHYTMGGVAINERAEVLRAGPGGDPDGSGATVKGLYAAGEEVLLVLLVLVLVLLVLVLVLLVLLVLAGPFCEAHGARPGSYFIFYADHEHIVRLAVRQQLPEDVQAAIAAARAAAMVIRSSPPRATTPPSPQEQQQVPQPVANCVSSSTALLPPDQIPTPALDDPMALDEMPLDDAGTVAEDLHASAVSAVSMVAKQFVGPEPPRSMPLQDRSNLPAGIPRSDALGSGSKPKPAAGKPGLSLSVVGSTTTTRGPVVDKENDSSAFIAAPGEKTQPSPSVLPIVSTGGLQVPAPATSRGPLQPPPPPAPQPVQPQPPAPSSPSPRSPPLAQPPPPATRLRLRFEARLRAQAGRLHPLSMCNGPESLPPSPPGYCGVHAWPGALSGVYPLHAITAFMGSSSNCGNMQPAPCVATGAWSHLANGFDAEVTAGDMYQQEDPTRPCTADTRNRMGTGCLQPTFSIAPQRPPPHQQQELAGQSITAAALAAQQQHCEDWRYQLHCDELLDWEVGRRAACSGAAVDKPAGLTAAGQHTGPRYPVQSSAPPPPPSLRDTTPLAGPMAAPKVNLGLLRQLLLLHGGHPGIQPYTGPGHADSGAAGQLQQGAGLEVTHGQSPQLSSPRQAGALHPCAATSSTLRQLLNMSTAWDLAPMSGAAVGHLGQPAKSSPQFPHNETSSLSAYSLRVAVGADVPPVRQHSMLGDPPPPPKLRLSNRHEEDLDNQMDVDWCAESEQEPEASTLDGNGARPKSALSIGRERDAVGFPDEPSCKRQRLSPRHLLVRKVLTAHDLLTDRVVLSMPPAACNLVISPLREQVDLAGVSLSELHKQPVSRVDRNASRLVTTAMSLDCSTPQRQQQYQAPELQGSSLRLSVVVMVESGARYNGVMVLCGPCGNTSAREWVLQGLRPYLIRRQAGVGDVLTLSVDDTDQQAGGSLRLVAQLLQCKAA
ncbi:hypothetical protein VOLCADRAFT_116982 [Volvox carteri f. nagariensis]|uniref:FAD-dependent oxidoreductase 2 FAD-binding domain-containing protein n=1 Tax=Volvox carteri f. nagariensis TaxID=3068 RepID=D8TR72_VOLCA|nr:uncharacterized protein VOLCADRAFT_116982 [Volvox carteri f. nagariensis]EFJ49944.1 hypothetical protein VOLCADRAFT_116982 [Volvox carteri f. nagariensis]|eukprot:XP_002949009.1 hypothetical protein VOLCADRAFT_116982 [Volvox carteri f. nagariensis]